MKIIPPWIIFWLRYCIFIFFSRSWYSDFFTVIFENSFSLLFFCHLIQSFSSYLQKIFKEINENEKTLQKSLQLSKKKEKKRNNEKSLPKIESIHLNLVARYVTVGGRYVNWVPMFERILFEWSYVLWLFPTRWATVTSRVSKLSTITAVIYSARIKIREKIPFKSKNKPLEVLYCEI